MSTYYAVCNVNGPISRAIIAESDEDAVSQFHVANAMAWIDEPATDAEDALDIDGTGMDEAEFSRAMEAAGCTMVRDLAEVVAGQGATTRSAHVVGGWELWRAD